MSAKSWGNAASASFNLHAKNTDTDVLVSLGFFLLLLLEYCNHSFNVVVSLLGMLLAVLGAFSYARSCGGTLLNAKGLFCISWVGASSLSLMRLHPSQVPWSLETTICVALAFPCFAFAYNLSRSFVSRNQRASMELTIRADTTVGLKRCLLTLFGAVVVLSFVAECLLCGYVPIFSNQMSAYHEFSVSCLHYVTVASGIFPALVCYELEWGRGSLARNRFLVFLTVVVAFIPVAIVSRQLLIMELFLLICAWAIKSKNEFKLTPARILGLIFIMLLAWIFVSSLRNQSSSYLISALQLPLPSTSSAVTVSFWQLYMYVSLNFDNLNNLINNYQSFLLGAKMLYPVLAFVAAKSLLPASLFSIDSYQVLPVYTTFPVIVTGCMDFGLVGALMWMALLGGVSAIVEMKARRRRTASWIVALSLFLYGIIISFFVDEFTLPVFWVYMIILGLYQMFLRSLAVRSHKDGSACRESDKPAIRHSFDS